ncbi:helix-turn-helix domain-containing protein [Actinomadura sp. WMMA1423]|uniref:helix-turn-helix domain-containing protein n=1 Tax=Actinomadura sp. WMMA1423 TaxID=2591108 RepID=UPI00197AF00D|nr:helix-turn-helix domain-containing protein [Actinomadura sp. WMMA1423]
MNVEVIAVTPELPTLLTIPETARELRVAKSTAADLVAKGVIESIVVGERSRRVPREALLAYIHSLRGSTNGGE